MFNLEKSGWFDFRFAPSTALPRFFNTSWERKAWVFPQLPRREEDWIRLKSSVPRKCLTISTHVAEFSDLFLQYRNNTTFSQLPCCCCTVQYMLHVHATCYLWKHPGLIQEHAQDQDDLKNRMYSSFSSYHHCAIYSFLQFILEQNS